MKKLLAWVVSVILVLALSFAAISCKTEPVAETAEETAEPAAEAAEETTEPAEETAEETTEPVDTGDMTYSQAPMIDDMGLAAVEERLPDNPKVIEPLDSIGQYGGSLIRGTAFFIPDERLPTTIGNEGFFELNKPFPGDGPITGNLAEEWEWNAEATELIIHLRKGLKWSDGEPFKAEDVTFFWNDVVADENVPVIWYYSGMLYQSDGSAPIVTEIDENTVKFEFIEPSYMMETRYSLVPFVALPKHKLAQFHPSHTDGATYDEFNTKVLWREETGKTVISAWSLEEFAPDEKMVLVRNPYFFKVDTAGNQLPYLDRVEFQIAGDRPSVALGNVTGIYDFDGMWVGLPHYSMFIEEQPARGFLLGKYLAPGMQIMFNMDAKDEEVRAVIRDVNIRRAISMAIDRDSINRALLFDQAVSVGAGWTPDSAYFQEEWGYLYSDYDIDGAKKMLDDAGIVDTDGDNIRELPTGEKAEIIWDMYEHDSYSPMSEMIVSTVKELGINLVLNQQHQTLHTENMRAGNYEISTYDFYYAVEPFIEPAAWLPWLPGSFTMFHVNGLEDPVSPEFTEFARLLLEGGTLPFDDRIAIGQAAGKLAAEQVWMIHVGLQNRPYIMQPYMKNIPLESIRVHELGVVEEPMRWYQVWKEEQ